MIRELLYNNYQGDEEKAQGFTPLELMDKNYYHKLPTFQVHNVLYYIVCTISTCRLDLWLVSVYLLLV